MRGARLIGALVAGVLVTAVAGCGDEEKSSAPAAARGALPVTVDSIGGGKVTVKDASRIVPLNGDVAEIVFALGLADRVVGVDLSAMSLPEARAKKQIGYQRALSAEGVLALRPTVLVGTPDAGPPPVIQQLRGTGTATVIVPNGAGSPDPAAAVADRVRKVATALGVPAKGEQLAAKATEEINAAKAKAARTVTAKPRVAFLYLRGQSKTYQLGGAGSHADTMIKAVGGEDAGTAAGVRAFKPITAEAMVRAKPDVLLVTTTGLASVGGQTGLLKLPGIAQTPAAANKRIVAIDDLPLLGMGPRTGAALDQLATALAK